MHVETMESQRDDESYEMYVLVPIAQVKHSSRPLFEQSHVQSRTRAEHPRPPEKHKETTFNHSRAPNNP